jgi:hypothetical protein
MKSTRSKGIPAILIIAAMIIIGVVGLIVVNRLYC